MESIVKSPQLELEKKLAGIGENRLVVVEEYLLLQNVSIPGNHVKLSTESLILGSTVDNVVYVVRPNVELMNTIANQVQLCSKKNIRFQLWFIPTYSALCEKQLEQRGVRGAFSQILELAWNSIPVDVILSPHLKSERTNLQLLQESACIDLMNQLKKIVGKKVLIIEQSLLGVVDLVTHLNVFKSHKIQLQKFNETMKEEANFPSDITNIIYLVRPQVQLVETITVQVRQLIKEKNRHLHLFFVPRRSCLCENFLEEKGMHTKFTQISEVRWNFLPLDRDVVSMEISEAFRDVNVYKDPTVLYQAALGLMELQRLYGRIPKIRGKGANSQSVWDSVQQLSADEKSLVNGELGAIDQLIILDRSIDPISALATQLTYEGLLDEFYNVKQNKVSLPMSAFTESPSSEEATASTTAAALEKKVIVLHSGDAFYADMRNKNFEEVRMVLRREVKELESELKRCSANKNGKTDIGDIEMYWDEARAFNKKKTVLSTHTNIASILKKEVDTYDFHDDIAAEQEFILCEGVDKPSTYIENLIANKADLRNVLRLMCLQCTAASGLKEKVLNYYKRELVQVYGIETLLIITNLEKAGLLHSQSESRSYEVLRRTFNLTEEHANEIEPKDITYVHNIYAPLTVRIVEHTLKQAGWTAIKSQINNLPGPTFEDNQIQLKGISGRTPSNDLVLIPRVVLVFFVGGCTFAEIAALRFLAQQEDKNVEFLIATTKIINKNNFLDILIHSP